MLNIKKYQFWLVTGSQDLYGEETLRQVAEDSKKMVDGLNDSNTIDFELVWKPTVRNSSEIYDVCNAANNDENCAGIITWMHTFSPSKMWIHGLSILRKPQLHFHTQFNSEIPWETMDMDFMNLNQSAHGDREFGFINARMRNSNKIVVGHWEEDEVRGEINNWTRVAVGYVEGRKIKIARLNDNMRDVAVTEGDKVEAAIKLGWTIDGFGIGDLVEIINEVKNEEVEEIFEEYKNSYTIKEESLNDEDFVNSIKYQGKVEIALKRFLEEGGYTAFTTNFQALHGMEQLPGLAVQRLMEQGYGFGGEGDWKTAGLVRIMKIMAGNKRTSFMEDYTYDFKSGMILGAHMLEVCPTLSEEKPVIDVKQLSIGGKKDPARLIFNGNGGTAVAACLVDMGGRMRLIVNEIDAVEVEKDLPKLPVARLLWTPRPSLKEGAKAWIIAGGAHHTSLSFEIDKEQMTDLGELFGVETVIIDETTNASSLKKELRFNEIFYMLNR